jgi:hypothetical protein
MPRETRTRAQVEAGKAENQQLITAFLIEHQREHPLARPPSWKVIQQRVVPHLSRSAVYWYLDLIRYEAAAASLMAGMRGDPDSGGALESV